MPVGTCLLANGFVCSALLVSYRGPALRHEAEKAAAADAG